MMVYTLTSKPATAEHEKTFGKWGAPPPNLREVSQEEFARYTTYSCYSPTVLEYRQFPWELPDGRKTILALHLHFYHNQTGCAIDQRSGKLHFYLFGCQHTFEEIWRPSGNRSGEHHDRCTKCGYNYHYDTSD